MKTVAVKISGAYPALDAVLWDESRDAIILAAPCCRARSAFLAWLATRAMTAKRPCVYLSANPAADRELFERWGIDIPRLVIIGEIDYDKIPVSSCEDLVVADAEVLPDPRSWAAQRVRGHTRFIGKFPLEGTWLFKLVAAGVQPVYRLTAHDAARGGAVSDVELQRVRASLPASTYSREYLGEYVEADARQERFNVFSRTKLKIRDKSGVIVPFRLNSIQRTYDAIKAIKTRQLLERGLPVKFLLLKYRRGGFTTFEQGQSYHMTSRRENMEALTLSHTNKATQKIFRIAKLMHLKDPDAPELKGVGNEKKLEFKRLNSVFAIGTAAGTAEGRGDTLQRVHGSEISKWGKGPRRHEYVSDLLAGLTEAASHGEVVLETTPNGVEWFAETWREAKANQNDWTTIFLPWYWDPTYRMEEGTYVAEEIRETLQDDERELIKQHRLTLSQIAWRRMKLRGLRGLFKQEYPEDDASCFLTLGHCYFDVGTILDIIERTPDYERTQVPGGYKVVWEKPVPDVKYFAGCDTSEGSSGSDPNGVGVIRGDTGAQVASIHGVFDPTELAGLAREICKEYNEAVLGVERNNHGHAVLQRLLDWDDKKYYHNTYVDVFDGKPGWNTSPRTRPIMLSDLRDAIHDESMLVRDRQLLEECLVFVKQINGKYEGKPDDCVMKWAIAWQMYLLRPEKSDIL